MSHESQPSANLTPDIVGKLKPYLPFAILLLASLIIGVTLPGLGLKLQLALPLGIAAVIIVLLIMKNPWTGVYLYFLYDFLRPYDFIPALEPLRLAMAIEMFTLISWLFHVRMKGFKINWTRFNWYFLGFICVIGFSIFTSLNNRLPFNIFQSMVVIFVMLLISSEVVDNYSRFNKIIWLLLLIHLYYALRGIYNYAVLHTIVGGMRTSGAVGTSFLGDENDFAMALNVMLPFSFFILTSTRSRIKKMISAFCLVASVIAIVFSFSRGGWVGLAAVIVFCIFRSKRKLLSFAYAAIITLVLVAVAPQSYWKEIRSISDTQEQTAVTRFHYWRAALGMYLDHPVAGVGAGNGGIYMPQYITGIGDPSTQWGRAFHGTIPHLAAELGTVGLIFYFAMLISVIGILRKVGRSAPGMGEEDVSGVMANSIGGGLVGYFACSTFLSTPYYPQLWLLYTLTMMLYFIHRRYSYTASKEIAEVDELKSASISETG